MRLIAFSFAAAALFASCGSDPAPQPASPAAGGAGAPAGQGGSAGNPAGQGGSGQGGAAGGPIEPPFCGKTGISKGPWVLSVEGSSAVVRWETCLPGPTSLSYAPEAGGEAISVQGASSSHEVVTESKSILPERGADLAGTWWLHEVKIEGLSPSTCYGYQAAGEAKGRFCTARASGEPLRFTFIADTNPGLHADKFALISGRIAEFKPDLSLHGGDMQYYSSALEPYPWWFEAMAPQLRVAPLWPTVGNHELEKDDEFADYYARFWGGIGRDNDDHSYHFESAGLHFFSLNTESDLASSSPQFAWAKKHLEQAPKAPGFLGSVVFFHRPLVTCGDSGDKMPEYEALMPIFKASGVRLVIAGHMHGYERFDLDGIPFVVAGGGCSKPGDVEVNTDRPLCKFRKAQGVFYHAVYFELQGSTISAKTIDDEGAERDSFTISL